MPTVAAISVASAGMSGSANAASSSGADTSTFVSMLDGGAEGAAMFAQVDASAPGRDDGAATRSDGSRDAGHSGKSTRKPDDSEDKDPADLQGGVMAAVVSDTDAVSGISDSDEALTVDGEASGDAGAAEAEDADAATDDAAETDDIAASAAEDAAEDVAAENAAGTDTEVTDFSAQLTDRLQNSGQLNGQNTATDSSRAASAQQSVSDASLNMAAMQAAAAQNGSAADAEGDADVPDITMDADAEDVDADAEVDADADADTADVSADDSAEDADADADTGKTAKSTDKAGSSDGRAAQSGTSGAGTNSVQNGNFSSTLFSLTQNSFTAQHLQGQPVTAQNSTMMNAQLQMQQAAVNSDAVTLDDLSLSIATRANQGVRLFDINLTPPELGRVQVKLAFGANGTTNAHITADSPKTLQMLQQDAGSLARQLADAGMDLSGGGLNFSLRQGNSGQQTSENYAYGDSSAVSVEAVATAAPEVASSLIPLGFGSDQVRLDIRV